MAPVAFGGYVLYGGLFDPWFTVFSYLKVILFKATATAAAGILVLVDEEFMPPRTSHSAPGWRGPATGRRAAPARRPRRGVRPPPRDEGGRPAVR